MTRRILDCLYRLRWHLTYTAAQCERDMRRMTNGERGCANPNEHFRKGA